MRHYHYRQIFTLLVTVVVMAVVATGSAPSRSIAQTLPSLNTTSQSRVVGPYTPAPQRPFVNDGRHRIFASNDLGMHCSDFDSRILSILPPFNLLHAQVLATGVRPSLLDDKTVSVVYSAAANSNDPALENPPALANDGGVYKTNFWDGVSGYAPFYPSGLLAQFFAAIPPRVDIGLPTPDLARLYLGDGQLELSQQTMPSVTQLTLDPATHAPVTLTTAPYMANLPQPFRAFEQSRPMFTKFAFGYAARNTNWFAAEGVPMTPFDDMGRENAYPLLRVQAVDKTTGAALASLDAVAPVSGETNCKNCHLPAPYGNGLATKRVSAPKIPSNDPAFDHVLPGVSEEWASDVNTLLLHDTMHGTRLYSGYDSSTGLSAKPVVCQTCHYTPALDLAQLGPQDANGLTQTTHQTMSQVMHHGHGVLTVNGGPLFPNMPPPNDPLRANTGTDPLNAFTQGALEATCYQCHPGKRTQCLRGAMYIQAGAVCQDCHGQMTQVGNDFSRDLPGGSFVIAADFYTNPKTPRVPWLNEPTCGSCHTGDAVSNMANVSGAIKNDDKIRLLQAFLSTDPKATPILPTNMRFAEPRVTSGPAAGNPQLFRLSVDSHGGVFCEGCHGATHAEWPVGNPKANDNVVANQLHGHAGKITECNACHTGSLGATLAGPHGMHPVGNNGYSAEWVKRHGDYVERVGVGTCKACHGLAGEGTVLATVAVDRPNLKCEKGASCSKGSINLVAGTAVTCSACHANPVLARSAASPATR
jgi:hypothetical protein